MTNDQWRIIEDKTGKSLLVCPFGSGPYKYDGKIYSLIARPGGLSINGIVMCKDSG